MASRKNGDFFEYEIAFYSRLCRYIPFDDYTISKYKKLLYKYDYISNFHCRIKSINNELKKIQNSNKIYYYRLVKDTEGKSGQTDDIKYYSKEKQELFGLSLKRKNNSIKHNRPKSIIDRICSDKIIIDKYAKEYKLLNEKYYEKIKDKIYFRNLDNKENLYKDFNNLICKYITTYNLEECLYDFIFKKSKYILKMLDETHIILKEKSFDKEDKLIIKTLNYNTLLLKNNSLYAKLRIHTASSKITPTLSLKYDITIENFEEKYNNV